MFPNKTRPYSKEDIDFIKENYPKHGSKLCSEKLNRTIGSIQQQAKINGIKYGGIKYRYSKENIEPLILKSQSITDALLKMELAPCGPNINILRKYIEKYNINTGHFLTREQLGYNGSKKLKTYKPINEILIKNSSFSRTHLKNRLYKEGIKKRECELCGQDEIWKGKKISLILVHKNGIFNDNRLKNLRIVCPNCNATLETHCGRNKGTYKNKN